MPAGLPLQSRFLIMFILYGIRRLQSRTWICSKYSWKHPRPSLLVMYILPAVWLFHKKLKVMYIVYILAILGVPTHSSLRSPYHSWSLGRIFRGVQAAFSAVIVCLFFPKWTKSNQIKSINSSVIQLKYDFKYIGEGLKPKSWLFWEWFHNKKARSSWSKVVGRPLYRPKLLLVSANKNIELLFTTFFSSLRQQFPQGETNS